MCLTVDHNKTIKAKTTRSKGEYVTRWKDLAVSHVTSGCLSFDVLSSRLHREYIWKQGWNYSDHNPKVDAKGSTINRGIHVYTSAALALTSCQTNRRISVRCYAEDLIACSRDGEEVYTKVFVTREALMRALSWKPEVVAPTTPVDPQQKKVI